MRMTLLKCIFNARSGKAIIVAMTVLLGFLSMNAFAADTNTVPSNFAVLTSNISSLELQLLKIVQIVVTLAGILLVFRGVVHLKQHSTGSPQEKHLPKGISNIIFAAILFMVVPLLHMFVGTLSDGVGGKGQSFNAWTIGDGAGAAGSLTTKPQ